MRASGGAGSRSDGGGRGKEAWAEEEWDEGVPNVDVDAYGSEENAELLAGTKVQMLTQLADSWYKSTHTDEC